MPLSVRVTHVKSFPACSVNGSNHIAGHGDWLPVLRVPHARSFPECSMNGSNHMQGMETGILHLDAHNLRLSRAVPSPTGLSPWSSVLFSTYATAYLPIMYWRTSEWFPLLPWLQIKPWWTLLADRFMNEHKILSPCPLGKSLGRDSSSCGHQMFSFMKSHQTIFQSGCPILHSHQPCVMVPCSSSYSLPLLLSGVLFFYWLYYRHSHQDIVTSPESYIFISHFHND